MATLTLTKQPALSLERLPHNTPVDGDTLYSSELYTLALKYRAMDTIASTSELLEEARGWLSDCFPYSDDEWTTAHAKDIAGLVLRQSLIGHYLVSENDQGQVNVRQFETEGELKARYNAFAEHYSEFLTQSEDEA